MKQIAFINFRNRQIKVATQAQSRQAMFIAYCNRMLFNDAIMAQGNNLLDSKLKCKAAMMFLRQGFCHASKDTSMLFNDQYLRDGKFIDFEKSLIFAATMSLSAYMEAGVYLIPLSDKELGSRVLDSYEYPNLECTLITLQIGHRSVICMQVRINRLPHNYALILATLLKNLGRRGALSSQDCLMHILVNSALPQTKLHTTPETKIDVASNNYFASIFEVLQKISQHNNLRTADAQSYEFYLQYITTLYDGVCKSILDAKQRILPREAFLLQECLKRLYMKLAFLDVDDDYNMRMCVLEFVFDEITNVLAILNIYDEDAIFNEIKRFLGASLHLNAAEMPEYVSLAGSCMQAINLPIMSALKYMSTNNKVVSLYIGHDVYHEIPESWGIAQDYAQDRVIELVEARPCAVQKYTGQMVDLMIMITHANVNHTQRGFASSDVHHAIAQQLQIRNANSKQLVVILDVTMSNLSDVHIPLVLASFSAAISEGTLAIILAFSTNKYLQVGFDRFPAGITAAFYNKNNFSGLLPASGLHGFLPDDPITQILTHTLRFAKTSINKYYDMVHGLSRRLHDLVPSELYNTSQPVHVDPPYTNDIYRNPWSFMVLRFKSLEISEAYLSKFEEFLKSIDITFRDGFAFNKSTYIILETAPIPIIRISIGPNAAKQQFSALINFMTIVNAAVLDVISTGRCLLR